MLGRSKRMTVLGSELPLAMIVLALTGCAVEMNPVDESVPSKTGAQRSKSLQGSMGKSMLFDPSALFLAPCSQDRWAT